MASAYLGVFHEYNLSIVQPGPVSDLSSHSLKKAHVAVNEADNISKRKHTIPSDALRGEDRGGGIAF